MNVCGGRGGGAISSSPGLDRANAQSMQTYRLRTFKTFCISVQLAPLDQLVVYVLWGYVALTTYFETSEAYFAV